MWLIAERIKQKYRTVDYPKAEAKLPERFMGKPHIAAKRCTLKTGAQCTICKDICPAKAISFNESSELILDMGSCTFCGNCAESCPHKAISFTKEYRLASTERNALLIKVTEDEADEVCPPIIVPVEGKMRAYFKRSFRIRGVSAAGCNACEADCNVLSTIVFDLARFGIDYVASPRHADAMLVTGPVPENMQLALQKCYKVMPSPKVIIAVGACAISGGIFKNLQENAKGVAAHLPINLYIPGCPPNPYTILDGFLRYLGRIT